MKKSIFLILIVFLGINVLFNFPLWRDIFASGNYSAGIISDNIITEFITETGYQKFIHGKNPISSINTIFYPFRTNIALNDPSYGHIFFFTFLRPFLDSSKSFLVILVLNFFLSNVIMFTLLRKLRISVQISFLFALVYGFMPFVSYRVLGHYTYTPLYLFPLLFICAHEILFAKEKLKRFAGSLFFGGAAALTLLLNFYYFIMVLLGIIGYVIIFFFLERKKLFFFFQKRFIYFFISACIFFVLLIPWFLQVEKVLLFNGIVKTEGFGGAQVLSGGFFNFFSPSEYNLFYSAIAGKLANTHIIFNKLVHFFEDGFARSTYPGIIILSTYFFIFFFRKRISVQDWKWVHPHLFLSIFFAILSMGPFFKFFNKWFVILDEGIKVYLPLPYLLFHFIPILDSLRAPARFTVIFVFFAVIVSAYVIHNFCLGVKKEKKILVFLIIFSVFLFDQYYKIPIRINPKLPLEAYAYIKKDPQNVSVLEIPFTVRDGFQYLGFVHAISPMKGQLIHQKPIIGGYVARVNPYIFAYYKNLPFINYLLTIIDKGNYDPYKEQPKEPNVSTFSADMQTITDELDFLDIRYVILKQNETYSSMIQGVLEKAEFNAVMQDGEYELYQKELKQKEFTTVSFGSNADYLHIAQGFSLKESGFRWVEGKQAKVFVRTDEPKKNILTFKAASFHASQDVLVYVNEIYAGQKLIDVEENSYSLDISDMLQPGINTVFFKFSQTYKPSVVLPNNNDMRDLAVKFYSLKIE